MSDDNARRVESYRVVADICVPDLDADRAVAALTDSSIATEVERRGDGWLRVNLTLEAHSLVQAAKTATGFMNDLIGTTPTLLLRAHRLHGDLTTTTSVIASN